MTIHENSLKAYEELKPSRNGATESTVTISGVLRVNRMYVSSSGTYGTQFAASQDGNLTLRESGAGNIWATIPIIDTTFGAGQSLIGVYTIPAGYSAYILTTEFSSDISGTKTCNFYLFKRENADDITSPYSGVMRVQEIIIGTQTFNQQIHKSYDRFPEKTDLGFLAKASAATDASVAFELLLVAN